MRPGCRRDSAVAARERAFAAGAQKNSVPALILARSVFDASDQRSEERRVGKEGRSGCAPGQRRRKGGGDDCEGAAGGTGGAGGGRGGGGGGGRDGFFFSSRRRHTRWPRDWSSDVCSSDL